MEKVDSLPFCFTEYEKYGKLTLYRIIRLWNIRVVECVRDYVTGEFQQELRNTLSKSVLCKYL